MNKNPLSFQLDLNPDDFLPASEEEKQSQVIMRESVSFWKDGFRRLTLRYLKTDSIMKIGGISIHCQHNSRKQYTTFMLL